MKTLDRTRSYASIGGDLEGRVFEQDETFFCADGTEWGVAKKAAEPAAETSQVDLQTETESDPAPVTKPRKKKGKG